MKMKMKAIAATLALLLAAPASAEELKIGTGLEGGGYWTYGTRMAERLENRGYETSIVEHSGSGAIALALCSGVVDVGIAQIDAVFSVAQEGCQLSPVATYGDGEVAVLLFPPESPLDELSDFDETTRIGVDGVDSGTELFWRTIVAIENGSDGTEDDWADAQAVNTDSGSLHAMAEFGDIDAAILVRSANSDQIKALIGLGWTVGELWDRDIDDQLFNGKELYVSSEVRFNFGSVGGGRPWAWVYEVGSFILVTDATARDSELRRVLQSAAQ